ncbi:MAG TPA: zinc ribbon domain-containing protein [Methylomirabilota bacterium]|nr:zinc ribbon domain-containing protein [Methylomirabilota bacterium]
MRWAIGILLLLSITSLAFVSPVFGQLSYSVTVSAQGLPSGVRTNLYVDGPVNGSLGSGESRTFSFASTGLAHVISVDYYVPNSTGTGGVRYYDSSPSWTFSGTGTHVFSYSTQFLLAVQTAYSSIAGGGWYDSGSIAQVSVKDSEVDEGQGTRLIFNGWTSDASGSNVTSHPILMNSPRTAVAEWKTQFLLTINSDPAGVENFQGSGWYDSGAQATFSGPQNVQSTSASRLRFGSWSGDATGTSSTGTVLMDRPKVVIAHYVAQYLVSVTYDPPTIVANYNVTSAGWYDADSSVQLGPTPITIDVSSVERLKFSNWIDNGISTQNVSLSLFVDKPQNISLIYTTQYYLDVETTHGAVSGSGWYDKGSTAKITELPESSWPIAYTFSGWSVDPPTGNLIKTDDSWSLVVDRPYTVEATWTVDYFPLIEIVVGASASVTILAAAVFLLYRRKRRGKDLPSGKGRICQTCGNLVPAGALFCQKCGKSPDAQPSQEPVLGPLEQKVYDYIIKNEGVISMSKAASELNITVEQLKSITEKLKKDGRLA